MGAWGAGSFDNDTALDFAARVEGVDDLARAFRAATKGSEPDLSGEIDADVSCEIIVAAECVAAMRGHRSSDMPADLAERVHGFGTSSLELFDRARDTLSAVMSRSELLELWGETESKGDFARALTDLMERLNQPQAGRRRTKKKKQQRQPNPSPCLFCDRPMGDGAFHMLDLTISEDDISTMKRGGWVHLQCLNAALHPKHMIQNWEFDEELLEWTINKLNAERDE
jgi:hypothetical protein